MKKIISLAAAAALLSVSSIAMASSMGGAAGTPSKMEESKTVKTDKEGKTTTKTEMKKEVDGKTVKETKSTTVTGGAAGGK